MEFEERFYQNISDEFIRMAKQKGRQPYIWALFGMLNCDVILSSILYEYSKSGKKQLDDEEIKIIEEAIIFINIYYPNRMFQMNYIINILRAKYPSLASETRSSSGSQRQAEKHTWQRMSRATVCGGRLLPYSDRKEYIRFGTSRDICISIETDKLACLFRQPQYVFCVL